MRLSCTTIRFRNPEDSLVDDIATGKLSLNMMQMAIREYVRKEKTMELMEWTEDKPEADGLYWAFAETWGPGITPVLIEVKDGLYKPVHSPHWRRVDKIIEWYKFAGPIQPPSIDAMREVGVCVFCERRLP